MSKKPRARSNGEGTCYQRKDGRWCATLVTGWTPEGRPIRRTAYAATRTEAVRKLDALKLEVSDGITADARLTVGEWAETWLKSREGTLAANTRSQYRVCVGHIVAVLGSRTVKDLRTVHVNQWVGEMLTAGLAASHVAGILTVLKLVTKAAHADGITRRDAGAAANRPAVERYEAQTLTAAQVGEFLREIEGDRLEALWLLAAGLGLRRGELLGLKWEDLDLAAGTLHIRRQWMVRAGEKKMIPPKRGSKRRLVIPAVVRDSLIAHLERQQDERALAGSRWHDEGLVFPALHGKPIWPQDLGKAFRAILQRAGLPSIRLHDLRHGTATALLGVGVPLKAIQALLGHSALATTADIYAHLQPESAAATAEAVGQILERTAVSTAVKRAKRSIN